MRILLLTELIHSIVCIQLVIGNSMEVNDD